MTMMTILRPLALAALIGSASAAPASAQSFDALDIAAKGLELGAAGLVATFRNKTVSVTGSFDRFSDTGYGKYVYVYFQHPANNSWTVTCGFERDDTAAYDRFALMQPGTPISATGRFKTARDVYFFFELEPCKMN